MFLKLLILSIIFLAIAALGFGIRMLIKKQGRFPETHVSRNPAMRKRGLPAHKRQIQDVIHRMDFRGASACSWH